MKLPVRQMHGPLCWVPGDVLMAAEKASGCAVGAGERPSQSTRPKTPPALHSTAPQLATPPSTTCTARRTMAVLGVWQAGVTPSEGRAAPDLQQANATGMLKPFQLKMQAHESGSMDEGACTAVTWTLVLGAWGCVDGRGKGIKLRCWD